MKLLRFLFAIPFLISTATSQLPPIGGWEVWSMGFNGTSTFAGFGDAVAITNRSLAERVYVITNVSDGSIVAAVVVAGGGVKVTALSSDSNVAPATYEAHDYEIEGACSVDCFPAHTEVATPTGFKSIGSLQKGDMVLSGNGKATAIHSVRVSKSLSLIDVCLAAQTVRTTRGHRFFTNRGWVKAAELRAGDMVKTKGEPLRVEKLTAVKLKRPASVYSLVLSSAKSFRVGSAQIVVAAIKRAAPAVVTKPAKSPVAPRHPSSAHSSTPQRKATIK